MAGLFRLIREVHQGRRLDYVVGGFRSPQGNRDGFKRLDGVDGSSGGVKDHLDPETGLSKAPSSSTSFRKTAAVTPARADDTSTGYRREKRPWLPPAEWEAKLRAEGKWVERRGEKGRKRGLYEDRGRERRGRSRSRSHKRYDHSCTQFVNHAMM